jgi:predicted nucleic acid-binding protein
VIVVDTSIWVATLRSSASPLVPVLQRLLDNDDVALAIPVRIELLSGASSSDRPKLRRALSALPVIYPTEATWETIDEWIDRAGRSGQRFGFGDLLIGALAAELDALVWSLDDDFERMSRLRFVGLYEP